MKAIIARDFGPLDQLAYADWPEPEAAGDTVVIETEAIGVNYPDGLLVQGLYQIRPPTAVRTGYGGRWPCGGGRPWVKRYRPGDRVAALTTHRRLRREGRCARSCSHEAAGGHEHGRCLCPHLRLMALLTMRLKQRAQLQAGRHALRARRVWGDRNCRGPDRQGDGRQSDRRCLDQRPKRAIAKDAGADIVIGYDNLKDRAQRSDRRQGRRCRIRPGRRRCIRRAGALDGVGGQAAGGRLRLRRHPEVSRQPGAGQRFQRGRRVTGAPSSIRSLTAYRRKHEGADRLVAGRHGQAGHRRDVYPLADAAAVLKRVLGRGAAGKLILRP